MKHSRLLLYPQRLKTSQSVRRHILLRRLTYLFPRISSPLGNTQSMFLDLPGLIVFVAISNRARAAICPAMLGANDAASCGSSNSYEGKEDIQVDLHGSIVVVCLCCCLVSNARGFSSKSLGKVQLNSRCYLYPLIWPRSRIMDKFHHGGFCMLFKVIPSISHGLLVGYAFFGTWASASIVPCWPLMTSRSEVLDIGYARKSALLDGQKASGAEKAEQQIK